MTREEVRAALQQHRQNHAMLLMLMRSIKAPIDPVEHGRMTGEFAEIRDAIERHHQILQDAIVAAIARGVLQEHRSGQDRRQPVDRRWRTR